MPRRTTSRANATAPIVRSPSITSIDQPGSLRLVGANRLARHAHLDGFLHADESRQPLRAFRAWNDSKIHLRLTHSSVGNGDTIMPGHRKFQPAAKRGAVHRHDDRLGAFFDQAQQIVKVRRFGSAPGRLFELLDVGAGDKRPAGPHDNDGIDRRIVREPDDDGRQFFTHLAAERIDRRVVDSHDGNAIHGCHGDLLQVRGHGPGAILTAKRPYSKSPSGSGRPARSFSTSGPSGLMPYRSSTYISCRACCAECQVERSNSSCTVCGP